MLQSIIYPQQQKGGCILNLRIFWCAWYHKRDKHNNNNNNKQSELAFVDYGRNIGDKNNANKKLGNNNNKSHVPTGNLDSRSILESPRLPADVMAPLPSMHLSPPNANDKDSKNAGKAGSESTAQSDTRSTIKNVRMAYNKDKDRDDDEDDIELKFKSFTPVKGSNVNVKSKKTMGSSEMESTGTMSSSLPMTELSFDHSSSLQHSLVHSQVNAPNVGDNKKKIKKALASVFQQSVEGHRDEMEIRAEEELSRGQNVERSSKLALKEDKESIVEEDSNDTQNNEEEKKKTSARKRIKKERLHDARSVSGSPSQGPLELTDNLGGERIREDQKLQQHHRQQQQQKKRQGGTEKIKSNEETLNNKESAMESVMSHAKHKAGSGGGAMMETQDTLTSTQPSQMDGEKIQMEEPQSQQEDDADVDADAEVRAAEVEDDAQEAAEEEEEKGDKEYDFQNLPYYACSYCGIHNPQCVVKCDMCNKWFCNSRGKTSGVSNVGVYIYNKYLCIYIYINTYVYVFICMFLFF
ncbi:hypothetical protein RFI_28442 [Reticulomyxa filosa]|uniref:Upf1 domain-containing protein n=1 Tax=Reticulomyxa filosa TaxID=46433 RepID=X6M4X0_RETFI|nr:hypothetical protein RFI_28442 [Reticulomyxa filosa]|eukprot:ETO08944.1 hypothetical protein RFI_28442 [Reticulomyxa filosa]